jgi:hypothetical protein
MIDHWPHRGGRKPVRAANLPQHIDIAATCFAKGEVFARDNG